MKTVKLFLLLCTLSVSELATADEQLAKKNNCLSCHAVATKLVGPAFKEVAAKYKGDKKAAAMLAAKIKDGGKGVWGEIPMPPNNINDREAKQLADWILVQK